MIDLTKENDDVMIISVENTGTDVARNRTNRVTRLASQRFASAYNSSNSSLPTNSSSDTPVESASSSTDNDVNDMEIIQGIVF